MNEKHPIESNLYYRLTFKIALKKLKVFFFIQKRKIKHSNTMVYFYFEEERKKDRFTKVVLGVNR